MKPILEPAADSASVRRYPPRAGAKRWLRAAIALGFGVSLQLSWASAALADDETATTMARERFKEGVAYFDQKQYDKARVAFMQAYALKEHPAVLLNLAQSELRSGHEADAAQHFSMYLRDAKDATAAEREAAEAGLFASKAVVGEVAVSVDAEDAQIFVDGKEAGTSPLADPLYLTPGTHELEARRGSSSGKAEVTAKAGEATEVRLRLRAPAQASLAPPPGSAASSSAGSSPEADSGTTSGQREPFFSWVGHTPLAWVGGGLTVLGVAGGIGFGVGAQQNYKDADAVAAEIRDAAADDGASTSGICTDPTLVLRAASYSSGDPTQFDTRVGEYQTACQRHDDNVSNGDTMKTLSIVSWAVAGAAAAGTVIYYFADSKQSGETAKAPAVRVRAALSPGFVSLQGEF